MTTKICDMCGKTTDRLHEIESEYGTPEIAEICTECLDSANKLLENCRKAQKIQRTNFIRDFIKNFKRK